MSEYSEKRKRMILTIGSCVLVAIIFLSAGIYHYSAAKIPNYNKQYTQEEWEALPLEKQQEIVMARRCDPKSKLIFTGTDCSKYKSGEK